VGYIAIPCAAGTCSYAAPKEKSKAENEVFNLGFAKSQKWCCRFKASKPSGAIINLSRNQGS